MLLTAKRFVRRPILWRNSKFFATQALNDRLFMSSTEYIRHTSPLLIGVAHCLEQRYDRVGYFCPIVPTLYGKRVSSHVELMQAMLALPDSSPLFALTSEKAMELCIQGDEDAVLTMVLESFDLVERQKYDFIIIEGSPFPSHELNALSWQLNATIARALNTPVLLCMDAGHLSLPQEKADEYAIREIRARMILGKEQCEAAHLNFIGTLVNSVKTRDAQRFQELLKSDLAKHKLPYLGFLPYDTLLASKRLHEVADRLGATCIVSPAEAAKTVSVSDVVVATSQLKEFLHHIRDRKDGLLVLTSADRSDMLLGLLASRLPGTFPRIAAILLTNGKYPDVQTQELLQAIAESHSSVWSIPLYLVPEDTYTTAERLCRIATDILPTSVQKIAQSRALMDQFMDKKLFIGELEQAFVTQCSPKQFQHFIYNKARSAQRRIVLSEGNDMRVLKAADEILRTKLAKLCILGDVEQIRLHAKNLGLDLSAATIVDPLHSKDLDRYVDRYIELRKHKGVVQDMARDVVLEPAYFGTLMVEMGDMDGMVSGACHTTADTIRPALQLIKTNPDRPLVSSIFFMGLQDGVRIFGDCAVNTNPSAEELAQIAVTSAESAEAFGIIPSVAMLSYATGDSNKGPMIDIVRHATEIAQSLRPDIDIFGPIQYDAAVDENIAKQKMKQSADDKSTRVAGHANVLIFPDLNTGNNTYKAVQQSTRCVAMGPMLQGLRKPVNDLSRGATVKDIITTVAITVIQAEQMRKSKV